MSGFSKNQLRQLTRKLDRKHVHSRSIDGRSLYYIEGWFALSEANQIFGYAGWDREMVHFERIFDRSRGDAVACGYVARVRVRVRAGTSFVTREGTGFGQAAAKLAGDAHERAADDHDRRDVDPHAAVARSRGWLNGHRSASPCSGR